MLWTFSYWCIDFSKIYAKIVSIVEKKFVVVAIIVFFQEVHVMGFSYHLLLLWNKWSVLVTCKTLITIHLYVSELIEKGVNIKK